jgi:DNA gyrase subunit A
MGIINLKVSPKTGQVVAVKQVAPEQGVMLITQGGMIIRIAAGSVSRIGRATQGVRVMGLEADDRIVAVAKIPERDEVVEAGAEADASAPPPIPAEDAEPDGDR